MNEACYPVTTPANHASTFHAIFPPLSKFLSRHLMVCS